MDIDPEDLRFLHASYRVNTDKAGDYVDFFFATNKWNGDIVNADPEKCDELIWVSLDQLPDNTVPAIKEAVAFILHNTPFSENGRT